MTRMPTTLAQSLRAYSVTRLSLRAVYAVDPTTTVERIVTGMASRRTGCSLVLSNGKVIGIFTERDFLNRVVAAGLNSAATAVESVMTREPKVARASASAMEAIEVMSTGGYRHLPIVSEAGLPIGVLSVKDVVRYLAEYFPAQVYNLPPTESRRQTSREGA